jgi:prolyl-tRNA synthetase
MFADMDLIGIPHRIVVGERGLESGQYEYKGRSEAKAISMQAAEILTFIRARAGRIQ